MTHSSSGAPPRLLDQVREIIHIRHYSIRTEQAYVHWIRRFILFHDKRHPRDMGAPELTAFLSDLSIKRNVAAVSSAGITHRRMHCKVPSSRPCIVRLSQSPQQCTRCAIRLRRIFSNQATTFARFKNRSVTRT